MMATFKAYRYIWAVNDALVQLGCPTTAFRPDFRRMGQEYGLANSLTPQEAAVMLVKSLGIGHQPDDWEVVAEAWRMAGKMSRDAREISSLLSLVLLERDRLERARSDQNA